MGMARQIVLGWGDTAYQCRTLHFSDSGALQIVSPQRVIDRPSRFANSNKVPVEAAIVVGSDLK